MDLPCEMHAIQYSPGKRVSGDVIIRFRRALDRSSKRLCLWRMLRTATDSDSPVAGNSI